MLKYKTLIFVILVLFGCGYFSSVSSLELNGFLKSEIVLIPLQVVIAVYMAYRHRSRHKHSVDPDN